jgi:hypothetical protein
MSLSGKSEFSKVYTFYIKVFNFVLFQLLLIQKAIITPGPSKRILFSNQKQDWVPDIHKGFRNSKHHIFFEELNSNSTEEYDLIVPLTIQELSSDQTRKLLINNPIPLPNLASIDLCDDKYQFNTFLISKGFGTYVPSMEGPFDYPYIFKKKVDQFGANTHIIHGEKEEKKLAAQLKSPDYFAQEIIRGNTEYATHIIFKQGKILHSLNIKYIFHLEMGIKGKDESITRICHCPYLEIFSAILKSIGFEGVCCFNYKVRNNIPYIIEINPRFGGSLSRYFSLFV